MTDIADTDIATIELTVDTWLEAYAEPDPARRAELVERAWATEGHLADPPFAATGHTAIAQLTDAVLAHYPGHHFRRTTGLDGHHGLVRYGWVLEDEHGTIAVSGLDVAEVDSTGRLARVVGFFGDLHVRS